MAKRSLTASPEGQLKAKCAFERTGWTQEQLALEVGLYTRQSVWKFFTGRPIERHIFIELCFRLNLDWQEIAVLPKILEEAPPPEPPAPIVPHPTPPAQENPTSPSIPSIATLRAQLIPQLSAQCGTLQASVELDRPVDLETLYVEPNILTHLSRQQWLEASELQTAQAQKKRQAVAQANPQAVAGQTVIQHYPKLVIFGKPGSGKTTLLKHLANQSIQGQFEPDRLPIFISLRYLDPTSQRPGQTLFDGVCRQLEPCHLSPGDVKQILQAGQCLILLDALDEVAQLVKADILTEIRYFTQQYYNNHFVITSRLTSQFFDFPGFVTVELDDFNDAQIEAFVQRWFISNHPNPDQGQIKANQFIDEMNKPGNQSLRELIVTPILLSLVCSIFLKRTTFPRKRDRIYQAGLDILLESWDQARGIQRDHTYQSLTIADKLKLLCLIAAETFERDQYFFEKEQILALIGDYLQSLAPQTPDPETLRRESETILKTIEVQHGLLVERAKDVFSFSHLTFQEYLAARQILYSPTPDIQAKRIEMLALRTDNVRWHEVLRLTANILPVGDRLLDGMSEQVHYFLPDEPIYQAILQEIDEKQRTITSACHPSAVRAFYLTLCGNRDLQLANLIDDRISQKLEPDLALDLTLVRLHDLAVPFVEDPDLKTLVNLMFAFELDRRYKLDAALKTHLDTIKQQLPPVDEPEQLANWQPQGQAWLKALRDGLQQTRMIGKLWTLTTEELEILQTYYELNLLLVECLQQSQIQPKLKQTIEAQLLKTRVEPSS